MPKSKIQFTSNYPHYQPKTITLLSTPERTGALPDYTGRGVVMAFVDAGFSMHPDIAERIIIYADASTNHVTEHERITEVNGFSWHGQMTSVIAAGDGRTSGGKYRGIASAAQLALVKVSTPQGRIKETDILRGLSWVYDTRKRLGTRIVNVSVGGDYISADPKHPLHRIVRKLTQAGIVVVISAGNQHTDHLLPPASAPEAVVVGGYDDRNTFDRAQWRCYHHNYGKAYDGTPKPDLLGPAVWIASPILPGSREEREIRWLAPLLQASNNKEVTNLLVKGHQDLGLSKEAVKKIDTELVHRLQARINHHKVVDAHHQHVDGTSVSAPIVASVVAQMLEANPALQPLAIKRILAETADKIDAWPAEQQGAGVLNAAEAVRRALALKNA
jgi:serine protease AprX